MDPTPPFGETDCSLSTISEIAMNVDILGIDLAKRVFQLHAADAKGHATHRDRISRSRFLQTVSDLRPRVVAMEACGSAHHWGRQFQALGIEVRLISPQYVSPFVKTNKNDRNDAEAIVEAASRPAMRFVPVKSVEQQDIQATHRVRELLMRQRTAVINQIRGLLAERGQIMAQSPQALRRALPEVLALEDSEVTAVCRSLVTELQEHLSMLEGRIALLEQRIKAFMKSSVLCQRISTLEGVGPITATAIVGAIGNASDFKNGRHLAAWLGLVPRQRSSGGKVCQQGISKRGDGYIRRLLIHGARAALKYIAGKTDARSRWVQELIVRRGYNRAVVALANKKARIIAAVLRSDRAYQSYPVLA
jgi:transposase